MNHQTLNNCPVCNRKAFTDFIQCEDYLVSHQKFQIVSCNSCGFRFTNPRPNQESIGTYYQSTDYISHNDSGAGFINSIYKLVRNYTLGQKLQLLNSLSPEKGNVLDIGCGTGLFLETCKRGGWQTFGVEPDPNAREAASKRIHASVSKDINEFNTIPLDVVTMWHVLEHVGNLHDTLITLKAQLKANGTLIIAVPNSDSLDAQTYKQFWAAYDLPRHLSHFTPTTITPLLNKVGFKLIEKKPMYFDAFYISMLSTKYKYGKTKLVESLFEGMRSNLQAKKTGNFSSLIYIFKQQ